MRFAPQKFCMASSEEEVVVLKEEKKVKVELTDEEIKEDKIIRRRLRTAAVMERAATQLMAVPKRTAPARKRTYAKSYAKKRTYYPKRKPAYYPRRRYY